MRNYKGNKIYHATIIAITLLLLLFTGYLFYFADCATIKTYWLVVQTPARCIQ